MRLCAGALWLLLATALVAGAAGGGSGDKEGEPDCPFEYERHTLDEIASGERRPWLYDGVFHNFDGSGGPNGRFCINCQRGSLWPTWCGRRKTKQAYWDLQMCEKEVTQLAMTAAAEHSDIVGALTMTPCDLFRQLRGRTLWIIGDSMSKDLIKAFKCFMIEFWDLKQYHLTNNFTAMHHLQSIPGYGEPTCIHMPGYTRMCQVHAIQGDLFVNTSRAVSGVLPLITNSRLALKDDIIVLNFGLWHGLVQRPRYIQHLHELGEWWSGVKDDFPNVFFMETPKQHFADAFDGDYQVKWLTDKKRRRGNHTCGPIKNVTYEADGTLTAPEDDTVATLIANGTWRNVDARRILLDTYGMPLVPIFNTSVAFWNMHRKNYAGTECSHFCHPSIPQLWLWVLHRSLSKHGVEPLPLPKGPVRERNGCAQVFERDETKLGAPKAVAKVVAEAEAKRRKQMGLFSWLFGRRR